MTLVHCAACAKPFLLDMTTLNASGERVEVVDDAQVSVCRPCALAVCAAIHLDFSLSADVQGCRMDRLTLVMGNR